MSAALVTPIGIHPPPRLHSGSEQRATTVAKPSTAGDEGPSPRFTQPDETHAFDKALCPDEDLIASALRGHHQAFEELCKRHSVVTKSRIMRILQNAEDTEDALQETLLRAFTHLPSFRRSCKFSTWLTAIGVNTALMMIRKKKVRRETSAPLDATTADPLEEQEHRDPALGPEAIYFRKQAIHLLKQEMQKLQPNLRTIVDYYYGSEQSLEESARAFDISVSAVKSRLHRGRARLRSSLERHEFFRSHT